MCHQSYLPITVSWTGPGPTPVVQQLGEEKLWAEWCPQLCPLCHPEPRSGELLVPQPAQRIPPQPDLENQHLQELSLPPKADLKVGISLKMFNYNYLKFQNKRSSKLENRLVWVFFSFENVKTLHFDKFRTHSKFFF